MTSRQAAIFTAFVFAVLCCGPSSAADPQGYPGVGE